MYRSFCKPGPSGAERRRACGQAINMAGKWNKYTHVLLMVAVSSSAVVSENTSDLQNTFENPNSKGDSNPSDVKSSLDLAAFQNGGYSNSPIQPLGSTWDAIRHEIGRVVGDGYVHDVRPQTQNTADDPEMDIDREEALRNMYNRLVLAAKSKRGLYGNVLGGYKLGKREFIPYEFMNEYQKRLFGSVLNNYKFGKRVPEELPENYVTGGQIYDNYREDPRERKRVFGGVLGGYKMGKRNPLSDYRVRRAWYPSYRSVYNNVDSA
ncbi:uncharacterized protein [Haliotis asinina]|uniref:uncharacterized protein isoform X1 n=1 Tax=Haliotis asinina TaxID=109174 RepID=UPI0035326077